MDPRDLDLRRHLSDDDLVLRDVDSGAPALDRVIVWRSRDFWVTEDRWSRAQHSSHRLAMVRADLPALMFLQEGAVLEERPERDYVADAAHVSFYNVGQIGRARAPWGEKRRGHSFYVTPALAAELVGAPDAPSLQPFAAPAAPLSPSTYLSYGRVLRHLGRAPADPLVVDEAFYAILRSLVPRARGVPVPSGLRRRIPEVQAYLGADPARPHDLDTLADRFGASKFHLTRVFREETGGTISAYLRRARLRRALPPILDGEDLTAVALAAGFSSHSHLTTAFVREFACPPRQARSGAALDGVRPE